MLKGTQNILYKKNFFFVIKDNPSLKQREIIVIDKKLQKMSKEEETECDRRDTAYAIRPALGIFNTKE